MQWDVAGGTRISFEACRGRTNDAVYLRREASIIGFWSSTALHYLLLLLVAENERNRDFNYNPLIVNEKNDENGKS